MSNAARYTIRLDETLKKALNTRPANLKSSALPAQLAVRAIRANG